MPYSTLTQEYTDIINNSLLNYLTEEEPNIIYKSMNYSIFTGGKRIRPLLLLSVCNLLNCNIEKGLPFAAALEMIHAYSLIHDDLPAMDDDDLRRGKPTSHIIFGEAIAILTGDSLLNKAFEIMSDFCLKNLSYENNLAQNIIAKSSGVNGMIGGQVVDILSENKNPDFKTLNYIHSNKTAALFKASLSVGAVVSGVDISFFENLGNNLGLAFQIKDDILDVISSNEVLGKPTGSDAENKKTTYVSLFGLEQSKIAFDILSENILNSIETNYGTSNLLYYLSSLLVSREK